MAFYSALNSVHRPLRWRTHLMLLSVSSELSPFLRIYQAPGTLGLALTVIIQHTLTLTLWLAPFPVPHSSSFCYARNVPLTEWERMFLDCTLSNHAGTLFLRRTLMSQYFPPIFQEMFAPLGNFWCVFCRRIAEDQREIRGLLIRDLIRSPPSPNIYITVYFILV